MTTTTEEQDAAQLAAFLGMPTPAVPAWIAPLAKDPLACLDGIGESKPKGNRKVYPTLPDPDGTASDLAKRVIELADAEDQRKTCAKMLGEMVLPYFFKTYHGQGDYDGGSVRVETNKGNVLVVCQSRIKKMSSPNDVASVLPLLQGKRDDLFRTTFELSIDGDEIPPAALGPLVSELKALFTKHGATKALAVKKEFKPYPAFHTQRHVLFTPEVNLEINRACPMVVQVKTKDVQ